MWQKTEIREDVPDHVIAFTHNEIFEALVVHFNDRFPTMANVESWRARYDLEVALIKLWDTPA